MDTTWHIATTPDGYYVHQLNPVVADERAEALIDEAAAYGHALSKQDALTSVQEEWLLAIRAGLKFPPRHWWEALRGWDSTITWGTPHPSLIDRCLNPRGADGMPDFDTVPAAEVTPESSVRTPQAWVRTLAPGA